LSTSHEDVCFLIGDWGSSLGFHSVARSVLRRLVLLGNRQSGVDNVEGRRLQQRQLVVTWPAADRGGLLWHG
jgi:hypothetical protein